MAQTDPPKRKRGRPKSAFTESSAGTLQSLDRALTLLKAVSTSEHATLSDLARLCELPTATAHRILTTLEAHAFVTFDEERQEWLIGIEAHRIGAAFLRRSSVFEIGRVVMRRLMAETGETANLAVPDGAQVVFVGQVETFNPIRAFFPPGTRTAMHASGTGKAILAGMSRTALDAVLAQADLVRFTPNTLVTRDTLLEDLADIRQRRWSYDREERYAGMTCIGAAIFDAEQQPCAGVSVSGPTVRFSASRVPELGALVAQAAAEITRLSGGQLP